MAAAERDLGRLLVDRKLVNVEAIVACLNEQKRLVAEGQPAPRLGEMLIRQGKVTAEQIVECLAQQQKLVRFCPACGILVNVFFREDAVEYRCNRCHGPLTADLPDEPLQVVSTSRFVVSKLPVPPDAKRWMEDPTRRMGNHVLVRLLENNPPVMSYKAWDILRSHYVILKRYIPDPTSPAAWDAGPGAFFKAPREPMKLRHPSIAAILEVGQVGTDYFIALEYVEGDTLADRMAAARKRRSKSMLTENPRGMLQLLHEIASTLYFAHRRPVPMIHGDVKPSNIVFDADAQMHIIEFGVPHGSEPLSCYNAPEQIAGGGQGIDARADIYAFGAIVHELLRGEPPFVGASRGDLVRAILENPPDIAPDNELARKVLQEICMACLENSRDHRPASLDKIVKDLDGAVSRMRLQAPPGSVTIDEFLQEHETKVRLAPHPPPPPEAETVEAPEPIEAPEPRPSLPSRPPKVEDPPPFLTAAPAEPPRAEAPPPVASGWTWKEPLILLVFVLLGIGVAIAVTYFRRQS